MNVWTFTARLGADAELKHVGDSTVTEFRCAVASGYGKHEQTTWARCSLWGKRGEALMPHLLKGKQVVVSGELAVREYDKTDGSKWYSTEVRVNEITLVGGKAEQQQNTPPAQAAPQPQQQDDFGDDCPF